VWVVTEGKGDEADQNGVEGIARYVSRHSTMRLQKNIVLLLALLGISAPTLAQLTEATDEALKAVGANKGVILLDVYWNRVWGCGRFENAQLRSLTFERLPLAPSGAAPQSTLTLENPSRLAPPQRFVPYALLVEPGEYDLTGFEVGFARSRSDVGSTTAARTSTIENGRSRLGSFSVSPGEVVYLGNFAVDCYRDPIPWRYYTPGKADFAKHLEQYKAKYPGLKPESVVYRLFQTTELGSPYELQ